jgi:hypothetical protein
LTPVTGAFSFLVKSHDEKDKNKVGAIDSRNQKGGKESVKVDQDSLVMAFDDNSLERSYYLDRETGKIFNLLEDHDDAETEEITWQIEADGGRRFVHIPKLSMEEIMEEQDSFVESLEDGELKTKLSKVLESDRDGSRFEKFVKRHRDAREKWRAFTKVRSRERADAWLDTHGISIT